MKRLGQLLLERGWITRGALDRALAAQSAIGGHLGTCLLEAGAITEAQLLEALEIQHGIEGADADALRYVPEEVYGLIPDRLAARRGVLPIRRHGNTLEVAMTDPGDLAVRDEIAFAAGKRVVPRVALEVRVAEAIERYYGTQTSERLGRLIDRLNRSRYLWTEGAQPAPRDEREGIDALFPSAPDVAAVPVLPDIDLDLAEPPEPRPSRWRGRRTRVAAKAERAEVAASTTVAAPPAAAPPPAARPAAGPAAGPPAPRPAEPPGAPAEPAAAAAAGAPEPPPGGGPESIEAVSGDRDAVGRAVLAALRGHFDRAALFAARADGIHGWMGAGEGLDAERLAAFRVSFRQPSVFLNLRHGGLHLGPLPPMPAHRDLARCFNDQPPYSCFLLPVTIRGRLVAVLYGDRDGSPLGGIDLAEMRRLGAAAAAALERCIVLKKQREA